MTMSDLNLAQSFTDITQTKWKALVEKGLRGAEFETLQRPTADGISRGPLLTEEDRPDGISALPCAGAPLLEGRPWHITVQVRDPDIAFANQQLLEELEGGASALRISLCKRGIVIKNKNEMKRLLDQVHTDLIPIIIGPHNDASKIDLLSDLKSANLCLGLLPEAEGLKDVVAALPKTWRGVTINAAAIHDKGGTEAQELAFFAAYAAQTFRGLGPELAAKHIGVEITTDQDAHLSIAKLRAARRIYARIAEAFGVADAKLSLQVVTSTRIMQSVDPWTNMLRVMSAGFGAILGGADFITTRAFTHAIGAPTPFGSRIARNMQLMMMEESHLGQVKDAAFGSYFHEHMTDELAKAAWAEFQLIESEGSLDAFETRLAASAKARGENPDPILGVTLHPTDRNRRAKVRGAVS